MTSIPQKIITLEIDPEYAGERIDVYTSTLLEGFSRTRIQKLIEEAFILVNNKAVKRSHKLKEGDIVELNIPEDKPVTIEPENLKIDIVYEDNDLVIINKPAGMLTHPAPGRYTGTLVNAILYHCKDSLSGINGYLRPGIVHRLDKDTTGLIMIAKNDFTHQHLASQIQNRTVDKYYATIVTGNIKVDSGVINAPIGRHPVKREKMTVIESGREAITEWKVLERFKETTFVEAKIITGRTHQIRVHFSHIKHPVLGDETYGNVKAQKIKLSRQALQAYKISFTHPRSGDKLEFEIDLDKEIKRVLKFYQSQYLQKSIQPESEESE
jgi:23S rRNA pseudouridine1911/1915/1917 synthase